MSRRHFYKVCHSETVSLDDLRAYMSAAEFNQNWASANAWTGGTFTPTAVPEPTSGVLLLIGAAMMGLRRKRA